MHKYIQKRFAKNSGKTLKDRVNFTREALNVYEIFKEKNYEFRNYPLILDRIDFIVESFKANKLGKSDFSAFSVFNTIVDGWIQREVDKKTIPKVDVDNLIEFCEKFAFVINDTSDGLIDEDKMNELENAYLIKISSNLLNLNNRSLLKKVRLGKKNYYGFVHRSFMEFFLVQYALKNEVIEDNDTNKIDFANLDLAQEMYISKKFITINQEQTKTYRLPKVKYVPKEGFAYNEVPLYVFQEWYNYFDTFTQNQSIKDILPAKFLSILNKENKSEYALAVFDNLMIHNDNFWDSAGKKNTKKLHIFYHY